MRTFLHLLIPTLSGLATAFAHPVTRLAGEWIAPTLTSPKVFALVDTPTGTVRIATLDGGATVDWSAPISTGVSGVGDVTAALSGDDGEILALTSPPANRIVLLDMFSPAPYPRIVRDQGGIGPSGLGSIGSPASRDLLVASAFHGSTPGKLNTHSDLSGDANVIADSSHPAPFRRIQPLTDPGGAPTIGLVSGASGVNTRMELADRDGGSHSLTFGATFTDTVEFATNVRSDRDPDRLFTLGYRADDHFAQLIEFATPLTTASDSTSHPVNLPFAVSTVVPILDGGAGDLSDGFIAIAADGSRAAHLRINSGFDGIEPPARTFSAEPGAFLKGLVPAAGIGLVKLNADTPGGPTTSYNAYRWDGSDWIETDSGTLPEIPAAGQIPATLLFYNANPIDDEAARLLGVRPLASWTRRTTGDPVPASVLAESFVSSTRGLTAVGSETVNPPAGTQYVITTQFAPGISIAAAAGIRRLMTPDLRIDPPSGTYRKSFQVAAGFDDSHFDLLYRRDGGAWRAFSDNLPVAWSTTLQFMLRSGLDGSFGPIVTRDYTLPSDALADLDSDNDGVPDHVEEYLGLDPFGGPDSDGDGVSDLDEILQGTNPLDPTETPSPNETANISPGGGVSLVASTLNASGIEIADGEDLEARAIDGSLLARAAVGDVSPALPDGGSRGALLRSSDAQPFGSPIAIRSPLYFDDTSGNRSGREIIGFVPADPPPPFDPGIVPGGADLVTRAEGWITAARAAAASHPVAEGRRVVGPADSAVAILFEEITHAALATVRPADAPAPALGDLSFLPGRPRDLSRDFPSAADRALLRAAGYDFGAALDLAGTARSAMLNAAIGIYQHHVANSDSSPGIPLPIDALRTALRGDPLPPGYAGAVSGGDLAAARNAYASALAQRSQTLRPIESWMVEILSDPPHPGVYRRQSDHADVALLDASGDRLHLERGLGLQPGSRFGVTGFSDTQPEGSYPTLEVTAASLAFRPAASDRDHDGNLLDDQWEKFFFGEIGQDPKSEPHGGGYTLLQFFLDGTDPRGGALPGGPAIDLSPQMPILTPDGGGYTLDFLFPAAYQDRIGFVLERSTTLAPASWAEVPGASITPVGGDELRGTIPAHEAPPGSAFYRVRLSLTP